ncbi:MAG TPA: hypothetical protein VHT30_12435 [Acidimicrobiales bacterium]|nr:hypothetical protein [Acidimicrobiales bacterium]
MPRQLIPPNEAEEHLREHPGVLQRFRCHGLGGRFIQRRHGIRD